MIGLSRLNATERPLLPPSYANLPTNLRRRATRLTRYRRSYRWQRTFFAVSSGLGNLAAMSRVRGICRRGARDVDRQSWRRAGYRRKSTVGYVATRRQGEEIGSGSVRGYSPRCVEFSRTHPRFIRNSLPAVLMNDNG